MINKHGPLLYTTYCNRIRKRSCLLLGEDKFFIHGHFKVPYKMWSIVQTGQRTLAYLHSHLKYCMHENSYNLFFMPLTPVPDLPGNNCSRHSSPDALGEVFVPRGIASFATNKSRAKVKDRAILTSRQLYLPIINVYVYFCHCNCQVSVYDEVTCTTIITS